MQNHAGGVDHRPQRVGERLAKLVLHRSRQTRKRKLQRIFIQQSGCDLLPQPAQHDARRIHDGIMAVTRRQQN